MSWVGRIYCRWMRALTGKISEKGLGGDVEAVSSRGSGVVDVQVLKVVVATRAIVMRGAGAVTRFERQAWTQSL